MAVEILKKSSTLTQKLYTGAGLTWRSLRDHGVTTVFGYPGGANLPLYDELKNHPIYHVLVRQEGTGGYMASGYGRTKDHLGVMIATSGPGGLNLITALKNMYDDSTPGLAITGQVAQNMIGTDAFQEADMVATAEPNTKWAYQIKRADEIPERIAEAVQKANSGRPGPVLLDFPKNIQLQEAGYEQPSAKEVNQSELTPEALAQIQRIPDYIKESKKPCIIAGQGVILSKAQQELLAFAEKTNIPVVFTLHATSAFPPDHPLNGGIVGMHGNLAPNILSGEMDLVIVFGARLDDRVTGKVSEYLPNAKMVRIDTDSDQLQKHKTPDLAINADIKTALSVAIGLVDQVEPEHSQEWLNEFKLLKEKEYQEIISKALSGVGTELKMAQAADMVSRTMREGGILVGDVGMHQMFAMRHFQPGLAGRYLTSGGLGAMGYGIPAAIGAAIAIREMGQDKDVIAFVGDGGAQMSMHELMVARAERLGVGFVIVNNHALGMVEEWYDLFHKGNRAHSSNLPTPDFAVMAHYGYGINAQKIDSINQLPDAMRRMFSTIRSGQPSLLEIITPEDKVYPMIPPGSPAHKMILGPHSFSTNGTH